jgi:hypothetical protein
MSLLSRLIGWLFAVLPFARQARGDREGGVDERDLDVAVRLGAPLDERQRGQDPFSVGEVLARGSVG